MSALSERWRGTILACALLLAAGPLLGAGNETPPTQPAAKAAKSTKRPAAPAAQVVLEPCAIDILKVASARLAAAKSMAFTAVVSYESPSRLGPPLVYATKSEVTLQRPDKLKVITLGDGPPSEFYYDGKIMMAFAPAENLVAIADAPPTIDAALQAAYDSAAIYFPFTDVIGQSGVVGGTTTDMVAYVTGDVFVQIWIGAEDKLPRRVYAVYLNDRARLRHVLELSNWALDAAVPADAFVSAKAAGAARMAFVRPDAKDEPGMKPPPKTKPRARPAKTQ